jgi:hypothetical protein
MRSHDQYLLLSATTNSNAARLYSMDSSRYPGGTPSRSFSSSTARFRRRLTCLTVSLYRPPHSLFFARRSRYDAWIVRDSRRTIGRGNDHALNKVRAQVGRISLCIQPVLKTRLDVRIHISATPDHTDALIPRVNPRGSLVVREHVGAHWRLPRLALSDCASSAIAGAKTNQKLRARTRLSRRAPSALHKCWSREPGHPGESRRPRRHIANTRIQPDHR